MSQAHQAFYLPHLDLVTYTRTPIVQSLLRDFATDAEGKAPLEAAWTVLGDRIWKRTGQRDTVPGYHEDDMVLLDVHSHPETHGPWHCFPSWSDLLSTLIAPNKRFSRNYLHAALPGGPMGAESLVAWCWRNQGRGCLDHHWEEARRLGEVLEATPESSDALMGAILRGGSPSGFLERGVRWYEKLLPSCRFAAVTRVVGAAGEDTSERRKRRTTAAQRARGRSGRAG